LAYQEELFAKYLKEPPMRTRTTSGDDHAWLGVVTQTLTDEFDTYWNLHNKGGINLSTVVAGSPAQQAGLREGDVIVNFNGTPIRAKQDRDVMGFTKLVREAGAHKDATIRILRGGEPMEIKVTLGDRPRSAQ